MSDNAAKYYKVLKIQPGASLEDVKSSYRRLSQVWHPDRHNNSPSIRDMATAEMQLINEAYEKLQKHIQGKIDRAAADAFTSGVNHYRAGRDLRAIEFLQRTLNAKPNHAEACYYMGLAFHRLTEWIPAIEHLEKAYALAPDDADIHFALASAYLEGGRHYKAMEVFMNYIDRGVDDRGWQKFSEACEAIGDFKFSTYAYEAAMKNDPDDYDLMVYAAQAYRKTKQHDEALLLLYKVVSDGCLVHFDYDYVQNMRDDILYEVEFNKKVQLEDEITQSPVIK